MNESEVVRRVRAARDAQLGAADWPADWQELSARAVAPQRSVVRPLAVAASVAGLAAAVAVGIPAARGGSSPGPVSAGTSAASGGPAVAPGKRSATCDVAGRAPGVVLSGTPARGSGTAWNRPGYYRTLSHDPATMAHQLRAAAIEEERFRTGPGGGTVEAPDTFSERNLAYLELNYLRGFLTDTAFPASLEAPVQQVIVSLARNPQARIEVVPGARTSGGCVGTGYTAADVKGGRLPAVVFDRQGNFLGVPGAPSGVPVTPSVTPPDGAPGTPSVTPPGGAPGTPSVTPPGGAPGTPGTTPPGTPLVTPSRR
jgi:hypothetical protein